MSFWCTTGGDRHQHETLAEMRAAHAPSRGEESDSKTREPRAGTPVPATATVPAEPVPVAPAAIVTAPRPDYYQREQDWIARQPWTDDKKQDARRNVLRNRPNLPISPSDWDEWSAKWDAVLGVDAHGREVNDPRLKLLKGMIDMIPDGYYAAQADEGGHVDFIMLSRPNKGQYKNHIKVSTQHSENWMPRLALMPNGRWLVLDRSTIGPLMLVVADYRACARRYAIELQHCWVCNTALTDDRSRHYLIGPICDKKPQGPGWIDEVDNLNDGLSFEQLVARGMPTRVWQQEYTGVLP